MRLYKILPNFIYLHISVFRTKSQEITEKKIRLNQNSGGLY